MSPKEKTIPALTEDTIRANATRQSMQRGIQYYNDEAVLEVNRRGRRVSASVAGSDYAPYTVAVTLDADGGIGAAGCTCAYEGGGYCKHIVALLLTLVNDHEAVKVKQEIRTLLADLTATQLRELVVAVAEEEPAFADALEEYLAAMRQTWQDSAPQAKAPAAIVLVDLVAMRRQIRKDFRSATVYDGRSHGGAYWDYDNEGMISPDEVLGEHLATVAGLLDTMNATAATPVIVAIIEEWNECLDGLEDWLLEGNEEAFADTGFELDVLLAETLLSQELTEDERDEWRSSLAQLAENVTDFPITELALLEWWDEPQLVALMQGVAAAAPAAPTDTAGGVNAQTSEVHAAYAGIEDSVAGDDEELVMLRLRILSRAGRTREYLNLAQLTDHAYLYVAKIAELGDVARALAEGLQLLYLPGECLALANLFVREGANGAGLMIAAHGLDLNATAHRLALAQWIVPMAEAQQEYALALRAARIAYGLTHQLSDYLAVERLAGSDWPTLKTEMLTELGQVHSYGAIDIYLHEQMLEPAMALIGDYDTVNAERVIRAARAAYPDWGIARCKRNAERIMDAGKANHYADAVAWLELAHDIWIEHGRKGEWDAYRTELLTKHARKYKLVPMIRGIR
ncbi:MAG: SWIM zinc finger family protein [Anaerolineales bacterium]|nr:SWIM zinc finger family protein [Anaerolineales bacterium]